MRLAFVAFIACVCGAAFGQDANEPVSVINHGQPTPIVSEIPVAAPAVVTSNCQTNCCASRGCCETRIRSRCRCAGQVVRSTTRTVVNGAGEVVRSAGSIVKRAVTFPARVCRGGTCSCN